MFQVEGSEIGADIMGENKVPNVLIYENADGSYKVSMRTNGAVDVAAICVKHGGGGHVRAAGATMTGDPEGILQMLLEDIKEQL